MSMKSVATVAGTAAMLSACSLLQPAHHVKQANPPYDPATQARVRILTGNGTGVGNFWKNSSCYSYSLPDPANRVRVNEGLWGELKYSSTSVVIGMPPSPRKGMRPDGLDFKDFIKEYVVDANEPLTVGLAYGNGYVSCSPPEATFVPQAGQDYDAFLDWKDRFCWVAVHRIDGRGSDDPVSVKRATKCADQVMR
jgi:hypothetical protein